MVNDLANPSNASSFHGTQPDRVQRTSRLKNQGVFTGTKWPPHFTGTEAPLFRTSPHVSLHLAVHSYPLIFFVINR